MNRIEDIRAQWWAGETHDCIWHTKERIHVSRSPFGEGGRDGVVCRRRYMHPIEERTVDTIEVVKREYETPIAPPWEVNRSKKKDLSRDGLGGVHVVHEDGAFRYYDTGRAFIVTCELFPEFESGVEFREKDRERGFALAKLWTRRFLLMLDEEGKQIMKASDEVQFWYRAKTVKSVLLPADKRPAIRARVYADPISGLRKETDEIIMENDEAGVQADV